MLKAGIVQARRATAWAVGLRPRTVPQNTPLGLALLADTGRMGRYALHAADNEAQPGSGGLVLRIMQGKTTAFEASRGVGTKSFCD